MAANKLFYNKSHLKKRESVPCYFVPSFAVARPVSLEDESAVKTQKAVRTILGQGYRTYAPSQLHFTSFESRRLIEHMRSIGARPSPHKMREAAYEARDRLAEDIEGTPERLYVPLGQLARFGAQNSKLCILPLGWKGPRRRCAVRDEDGILLPLGAVSTEGGTVATSVNDSLAGDFGAIDASCAVPRNPHMVIAEKAGGIRDHELRMIKDALKSVLPEKIPLEDPVIHLRTDRTQRQSEVIYVRAPGAQAFVV